MSSDTKDIPFVMFTYAGCTYRDLVDAVDHEAASFDVWTPMGKEILFVKGVKNIRKYPATPGYCFIPLNRWASFRRMFSGRYRITPLYVAENILATCPRSELIRIQKIINEEYSQYGGNSQTELSFGDDIMVIAGPFVNRFGTVAKGSSKESCRVFLNGLFTKMPRSWVRKI